MESFLPLADVICPGLAGVATRALPTCTSRRRDPGPSCGFAAPSGVVPAVTLGPAAQADCRRVAKGP
jgi:hypothetical protein